MLLHPPSSIEHTISKDITTSEIDGESSLQKSADTTLQERGNIRVQEFKLPQE